jgi:hypothetical protein
MGFKNIFFNCSKLIFIVILLLASDIYANHDVQARLEIGINILPSVIAANMRWNIEEKYKQQPITLFIIYDENRKLARDALSKLTRIKKIRGHRVKKEIVSMSEILSSTTDENSVLFIVEPLFENSERAIEFSRSHQSLLFSPFKGDVEKGVMTGFDVTNKVLPAVNLKALKESNIRLKAFFLRIAVSYD